MGCGSSKSVEVTSNVAAAPASAPTEKAEKSKNTKATIPESSSSSVPAAKSGKNDVQKPVKKAEAFEVDLGDGNRTNSGKTPARLMPLHSEKKKFTAEELEAKLQAAEERRQAVQVEQLSKIKEHTDYVESVKAGGLDGEAVKRKVGGDTTFPQYIYIGICSICMHACIYL